jgi:hypothetical protein
MLLSFLAVGWKSTVIAQSPDNHTVYLPLVSKNYQEWLDIFNQYRKAAGLNPVVANDSMNYGLSLHTKYMLLNPNQDDWHTEYSDKPGYTAEGKLAASQSNMLWTNDLKYTDKKAIDLWMKTERHRYHMLNPYLKQSGFSLSCDGKNCFAGLNIYGGIENVGGIVNVVYPAENQINFPRSGFPITWGFYPYNLINTFASPSVTLYDSSNKPVSGKISLHSDHVKEVVFIPDGELLANHKYKIVMSIKVDNATVTKTWYFTTGSN